MQAKVKTLSNAQRSVSYYSSFGLESKWSSCRSIDVKKVKGSNLSHLFRNRSKPVNVVKLEAVLLASDRGRHGRLNSRVPVRSRVDPVLSGHRKSFQVRVEDGEVRVVLLQHPDGRPLDGELADGIAPGLAVR